MCLRNGKKIVLEEERVVFKFLSVVGPSMFYGEAYTSPYNSWTYWTVGCMRSAAFMPDVRKMEDGTFEANGGLFHSYEKVEDAIRAARRYSEVHCHCENNPIIALMTIPAGSIVYVGTDNNSDMVSYASKQLNFKEILIRDIYNIDKEYVLNKLSKIHA